MFKPGPQNTNGRSGFPTSIRSRLLRNPGRKRFASGRDDVASQALSHRLSDIESGAELDEEKARLAYSSSSRDGAGAAALEARELLPPFAGFAALAAFAGLEAFAGLAGARRGAAAFFGAAARLAAFLTVRFGAAVRLTAFLAAFFAGFLATARLTAFLAAFFTGFLAAFAAAGFEAFFVAFLVAFLAVFFAAICDPPDWPPRARGPGRELRQQMLHDVYCHAW